MQIDANFINDFFDYTRGNDDIDRRLGPLRACTQGWVKIDSMKRAIALTTCVACIVGLPLIWYGGLEMIMIGILCVVFCFLYTTHLSYIGMGDLLVVVFFGIVPVCITYYIQLHTCTWQVFIASVACGLVIDGLLIINNYRDRDNDREEEDAGGGDWCRGCRMALSVAGRHSCLGRCRLLAQRTHSCIPTAFLLPVATRAHLAEDATHQSWSRTQCVSGRNSAQHARHDATLFTTSTPIMIKANNAR